MIAATKEIIRPIQAAVEQFLKENTMLTSVIPMQMSYVQYIMRHRKDELMALQKSKTLQMKSARNRHEAGMQVKVLVLHPLLFSVNPLKIPGGKMLLLNANNITEKWHVKHFWN